MTIYLNCARVVLAAGALALAGLSVPAPAHADQYDFVVYLDNNGVYYSSVSGVEQLSIPVDRGVSGDLRFGVLIAV